MKSRIVAYNLKCYWSREYLDLATFCERQGLPDYFNTLTANDGWVELKAMLGGQAPHFRPVESTLLLMQKYRDIKDLLWGRRCIFGRATDHWQRIEFQNRGALHVHLLLWVDDRVADRSGKVVATVPSLLMKRHFGPRFSSTKSTTVERDGATRRENLNCASTGSRTSYRIGTVSLTVGCVTITPGLSGRMRELCPTTRSCSQPGTVISTSSV